MPPVRTHEHHDVVTCRQRAVHRVGHARAQVARGLSVDVASVRTGGDSIIPGEHVAHVLLLAVGCDEQVQRPAGAERGLDAVEQQRAPQTRSGRGFEVRCQARLARHTGASRQHGHGGTRDRRGPRDAARHQVCRATRAAALALAA
jgi:hypothetical protein